MDLENFKYNLKQLKKCNQHWDEMLPTRNGRFCGKCEKTIIDFSEMSFTEIAIFMARSKKSVCGFYLPEQLKESKKSSINLPLAVGLSSTIATASLANPEAKVSPIHSKIVSVSSTDLLSFENQKVDPSYQLDSILLLGKVQSFDTVTKAYLPTSYATVIIAEVKSDKMIAGTVTAKDGTFKLHFLPVADSSTFSLSISSIGFEIKELEIQYSGQQQINLNSITIEKYKGEISTFYVTARKRGILSKIWRTLTKPFRRN